MERRDRRERDKRERERRVSETRENKTRARGTRSRGLGKHSQTEALNTEQIVKQTVRNLLPEILIPLITIIIEMTSIPGEVSAKIIRANEIVKDAIQKTCQEIEQMNEELFTDGNDSEDEDYQPSHTETEESTDPETEETTDSEYEEVEEGLSSMETPEQEAEINENNTSIQTEAQPSSPGHTH